jgi:D-amino-acid dehydrogenase
VTLRVAAGHTAPTIGGVDEQNLLARARFGNRLRFTSTAELSGFDLTHRPSDFRGMLKAARELYPHGADFSRPVYWSGLRPMTSRGTPIIGKTRHRNLYFNLGHGHLGWTWSCGTARLLVDIIQGRVPDIDLEGLTLEA